MEDSVRWSLKVSRETDLALRADACADAGADEQTRGRGDRRWRRLSCHRGQTPAFAEAYWCDIDSLTAPLRHDARTLIRSRSSGVRMNRKSGQQPLTPGPSRSPHPRPSPEGRRGARASSLLSGERSGVRDGGERPGEMVGQGRQGVRCNGRLRLTSRFPAVRARARSTPSPAA